MPLHHSCGSISLTEVGVNCPLKKKKDATNVILHCLCNIIEYKFKTATL